MFKKCNIKISVLKDVTTINDVPTRQLILNDFHLLSTRGHAGINRMINNIKKYYHWKGLHKDIETFVKRCDDCQRHKHPRSYEMDAEGNKYILTIQCDLSKFVEAYQLPNKEALTVAKAMVGNFILRYGIPADIVTDQKKEFMSSIFIETCKILNVKQLYSLSPRNIGCT